MLTARLRDLGAKAEIIEPTEADTVRLSDTPEKIGKMVKGTFTGTGTKKILLMAYMDTVYPKGMAAGQPFKIEGDRVYGLGIADARGGLATILHTLSILKQMNYRDYGTLTVFFNGDEEIGSPGARNQHTRNGSEHDAVMSFEGGGSPERDGVRLATSGRALALLSVRGRASHAGSAPERGVNALDELSHQILQMRDLSNPKVGLKVNWTLARAGIVSNMIPPGAQATGDVRVERVAEGRERGHGLNVQQPLGRRAQQRLQEAGGKAPVDLLEAAKEVEETEEEVELRGGARAEHGKVQEVRGGGLRDGVLAVRRQPGILGRGGGVRAVLRRAPRVDVGREVRPRQLRDKSSRQPEVRLVDAVSVGLEGVRAVRQTVEHGARPHVVEEGVEVRLDQQVGHADAPGRQPFEAPSRQAPSRAGHIVAHRQEGPKEVCANEPARAQHEDWPVQARYLWRRVPRGHWRSRPVSDGGGIGPRASMPAPPRSVVQTALG